MRCGNRLVDLGDPIHKVKELCGDPDQESVVIEHQRYRSDSYRRICRRDEQGRRVCSAGYDGGVVQIPIHHLIYDFGRYRFVHYLRFEANRLVEIETGDYGVRTTPRPTK